MNKRLTHLLSRRQASASFLALALCAVATPATAQAVGDEGAEDAAGTSDTAIVVTGTRITRNGYQAPTPLTVVTAQAIEAGASNSNIASYLNTMPVLAGSLQPAGNQTATNTGNSRVNALNLRGIGTERTLVLLDGQRVVGAAVNGAVDINSLPQQLIQRVDVVTGGASAVYGSDAVAGVVNFVLDHDFTGVKGEISGGLTDYGDNPNYSVKLSAGLPFADGRGHLLLSGELSWEKGIQGDGGREWNQNSVRVIKNPTYTATNGQPENLVVQNMGFSDSALGGLIFSGPLKGTAFGPGGVPYAYNFGTLISRPFMVGGQWQEANTVRRNTMSLQPRETRKNIFARADYDLTDDINVFAQFLWSNPHIISGSSNFFMPGNGPTIRVDNAFLPESVRQQMIANSLSSVQIGTQNADLPILIGDVEKRLTRYAGGLKGSLELFGNEWTWNASYLYNKSWNSTQGLNNIVKTRFTQATDAVVNPATGAIVCRSTLTNPGNGCSPLNVLGIGVASQAGLDYVTETSFQILRLKQQVFDASLQGDLFNNWAGPVSLALSFAHRKESASTERNTETQKFQISNYGSLDGKYSVTEFALETVVPLVRDASWAKEWEVTGAVRATDYSTSGYVTTWKIGTTFAPIDDIRFRGTISRDIRAPNLNELFSSGTVSRNIVADPFTSTSPTVNSVVIGNPNLKPEKAISKSVGVVLQPSFLPGFGASVDYWDVELKDAITSIGGPNIVRLCFEGQSQLCSQIQRGSDGLIESVIGGVFNYAESRTRGIDVDLSYRFEALGGQFSFRASATKYLESMVDNGLTPAVDQVGVSASATYVPEWRLTSSLDYEKGPLRTSLTARAFPDGILAAGAISCTASCPTSTIDKPTYDNAYVPGSFYLDASIRYNLISEPGRKVELFANVRNLLNRDAPAVGDSQYYSANTLTNIFDYMGRVYRIGVRAQF